MLPCSKGATKCIFFYHPTLHETICQIEHWVIKRHSTGKKPYNFHAKLIVFCLLWAQNLRRKIQPTYSNEKNFNIFSALEAEPGR